MNDLGIIITWDDFEPKETAYFGNLIVHMCIYHVHKFALLNLKIKHRVLLTYINEWMIDAYGLKPSAYSIVGAWSLLDNEDVSVGHIAWDVEHGSYSDHNGYYVGIHLWIRKQDDLVRVKMGHSF